MMMAAGPAAGAAPAEAAEEQTEFDVIPRRRRPEDQRHQGGPRDHRPRHLKAGDVIRFERSGGAGFGPPAGACARGRARGRAQRRREPAGGGRRLPAAAGRGVSGHRGIAPARRVNDAFTTGRHGFAASRRAAQASPSRRCSAMLHQPALEPIARLRETALYAPVKRFLKASVST